MGQQPVSTYNIEIPRQAIRVEEDYTAPTHDAAGDRQFGVEVLVGDVVVMRRTLDGVTPAPAGVGERA